MCLFTSPMAVVQPTPRGKTLGKLLLYLMGVTLIIMILSFFVDSTLGLFALFLVLTGWCAVRKSDRYNIEQTMCVVFLSGYLFVIALVDCVLYLVSYSSVDIVDLIALFGGLIFYGAACYVSKQLYDELRLNYQPPPPEEQNGPPGMFGGGMGMGRMFGGRGMGPRGPPPQRDGEARPLNQGQIPPQRTDGSKFQAFSGTGHTLT